MKYKFTFFIVILIAAALLAQTGKTPSTTTTTSAVPDKPKLVIGIVIDQMRFDYVYKYWNKYGNDGFKRLVNQGYNCRNVNYNYMHC